MIVAEADDHFRFITQPAHAELAGRFADRWGADEFERPDPRSAVTNAAYNHDVGWWTYDLRPHLDDEARPVDFRDMPPETWKTLYSDGIGSILEIDRYAGVLVSMHGAGLRRRRYGLSPSWPSTPAAFEGFVEEQEALQSRIVEESLGEDGRLSAADAELLSTLHETGSAPAGVDSSLWRNYKLLQAWDTLSLSFCTTESPPSYGSIDAVPTGGVEGDVRLSVDSIGEDEYRISPYPFTESPLALTVPTRNVEKGSFEDEDGLVRAYYEADRETIEFRLRRGR